MSIQVVWNYGDYSCKWTLLPYWICNSEGIAQSLPTDTQCWNSRSNLEKSYQDKSPPEVKGEGRGCGGELHQNGEATACGGRVPSFRRLLVARASSARDNDQSAERLPVATALVSGRKSLQRRLFRIQEGEARSRSSTGPGRWLFGPSTTGP